MDPLEQFKENARQGWAHFAPIESFTALASPRLLRFANVKPGVRLLDVGCGTGVAALCAARLGAHVKGVDLTPELIARAKENAALMKLEAEWHVGDAEAIPFGDASFDIVISQFGHMFAPRPEVAIKEMLRVLVPGGTIAFTTWPPELYTGRMFALIGKFGPPPPPGVSPPTQWGDLALIRERLGAAVKDIAFDRDHIRFPGLSPQHVRQNLETTVGPLLKLVPALAASDPAKLATFRAELDALIGEYFENNTVRQDFLVTRAVKV